MAMSRTQGNEILHLWREGIGGFGVATINEALRATGDLRPTEQKRAIKTPQAVDTTPHRVWRAALAGGNSEQPIN